MSYVISSIYVVLIASDMAYFKNLKRTNAKYTVDRAKKHSEVSSRMAASIPKQECRRRDTR
jgi:hypothetical protein